MERWSGKVAVVTGASAGIGLATAKVLVRNGMIVVGLARRVEQMQTAMSSVEGSGKFYAKACDISNESDINKVFQWIETNLKTVHVLVNNAGIFKIGSFLEIKTEDLQYVMDVNIMGLLQCTQQSMKLMKKNNHEAHIVNVNSTGGHKVFYVEGLHSNVYIPTKFALTAISETLINQIAGNNIRVTNLCPGFTKTEIFDAGNMDKKFRVNGTYLEPEDVADSIIYVISVPQRVQITELIIQPLGNSY